MKRTSSLVVWSCSHPGQIPEAMIADYIRIEVIGDKCEHEQIQIQRLLW